MKLWVDLNINNLHSTNYFGDAYDIDFKGDDFYIAGERGAASADAWNACYWKNGNLHELSGSLANEQQTWL